MSDKNIFYEENGDSFTHCQWSLWTMEEEISDCSRLKDGERVRIRVDFENRYEDAWKPCKLILALYEDSILTEAVLEEVVIPPYVPELYLTTEYLSAKWRTSGKWCLKGTLLEGEELPGEISDFLLRKAVKPDVQALHADFSGLQECPEKPSLHPSPYFSGYEKAKAFFAGSICFAVDSAYLFGLDRKYKMKEKTRYHQGKIYGSKKELEEMLGVKLSEAADRMEGYLSLKQAADELGLVYSENKKGLAVIADEPYDISGESSGKIVKEMLRYLVFERPDAASLRKIAAGKKHPHAVATPEILQQKKSEQDAVMQGMSQSVIQQAKESMSVDIPVETPVTGGYHGVDYHTVLNLYWAYEMTGEEAYARKAITCALTMAGWSNWQSDRFFLQTSFAMLTCSYVYDLFYDLLSEEQRHCLAENLVEKGLKPAREHLYGMGPSNWPLRSTNWNVVCNAGSIVAAIALCEDYACDLCYDVIEKGLVSLEYAMLEFGPDGGWYEGVGYSGYTVNYHVLTLQALDTMFGSDFGLANTPGFLKNAYFPFYMTASEDKFNLHDDIRGGKLISTASMWTAHYQKDAALQNMRLKQIAKWNDGKATFLDLLWYTPQAEKVSEISLDSQYHFAGIATSRSSWEEDAVWLGVHAGDNSVSHGQMDIGQFELEIHGIRFALDMGRDDYGLPDYFYFGSKRENYYVCRAEGHNVYVINPDEKPGQYYYAASDVETIEQTKNGVIYRINMAPAYIGQLKQARRGYMLKEGRKYFVLQDEIVPRQKGDKYLWFWHTQADIIIHDKHHLTLERKGERLQLYIDANMDYQISAGLSEPLPTSPKGEGEQLKTYGKVNKFALSFFSEEEEMMLRVTAVPDGMEYREEALANMESWKL